MGIVSTKLDSERGDLVLLVLLAASKFLIHITINIFGAYGFFRDEFYYIACSDHLAFGYVDHPPLSILLLKVSRFILGDSLAAIRFLPALAGALTVLLTGLIVKELGGGRFARLFAALCVLLAPLHLGINSYYSMNSFDILVWTAAAYLLVIWINRRDPRMWLWLGILMGLGLQNKISVLWLGFGLAAGLLLSENRRTFLTRWPWLAAGISLLIFLPHIIWQSLNGWPTFQFIAGATGKMLEISFLDYLGGQIMEMHPLLFPVWLAGLAWYLVSRQGKQYRLMGIIYISAFALLVISGNARSSYLAPAYPMLFASGAVVLERISDVRFMRYARAIIIVAIVTGGIAIAPIALPVLPAEKYINYSTTLGIIPKTEERHEVGLLPQFFADMHGWEEIVAQVSEVYEAVQPEDPEKWAVFTDNYGIAGAIDFLGRKYDLPPAVSGHNNYWLWGPGDPPPENLIILRGRVEDYDVCREAWQADTIKCGYCMPYENNRPVIVCKDLQIDPVEVWPEIKHFR
jgi:hypothetical protein